MDDLKELFRKHYLTYASYVILDRAIPHMADGLKPVQRRILWTLFLMDDGKLHKVANVAGQTMALHPHGDAPIIDALVNLANKDFLLDKQGNFGNSATGDPPAAARYIETRLSQLAKETLFNKQLTSFLPSYDGRAEEPVTLPCKIPLLLMQGAEGIAVGMATKILPHNFCELLQAEIAYLEERPFKLLPDFPSGGILDGSGYDLGRGKVKLRAKIDIVDEKTLVIREICYGTTTESTIRSIDEAAKKGKIKIDAINDYTAEKIEIEIKLPRGQYANQVINTLYAFTDCEVSIHSQVLVIHDKMPLETTVDEVLKLHANSLMGYLKRELEIERDRLLEKIFEKSLERIFIENRLYKKIEEVPSLEKIHRTMEKSFEPFLAQLARVPTHEDREKLLSIPIRRISRFDLDKNREEIALMEEQVATLEKQLKNIKRFTIKYLQDLLKKYGTLFPRRTALGAIEELDVKEIGRKTIRVGYDPEGGFLGTRVSGKESIECSNYDKLLIFYEDGSYKVVPIPEKEYIHTQELPPVWIGVADKESILNVIYKDLKSQFPYAKRFVVKQFIMEKVYRFLDEGQKLGFIAAGKAPTVRLICKKGAKKESFTLCAFEEYSIKGVTARGVRLTTSPLVRVENVNEEK